MRKGDNGVYTLSFLLTHITGLKYIFTQFAITPFKPLISSIPNNGVITLTIPSLEIPLTNGNMPFALSMLLTCSMLDLLKHLSELDNELDAILESKSLLSPCEHIEALTFNIVDHDMLLETLLSAPLESDV
tara:strand:+ start:1352 stop:1744 length:393 start_codon:yes stop_codon:yes gene_type:complete